MNDYTRKKTGNGFDLLAIKWVRDEVQDLERDERLLLQYLATRCRPNHKCDPEQRTIAEDLECSRTYVIKLLQQLEAKNLITAVRRRNSSKVYTLIVPEGYTLKTPRKRKKKKNPNVTSTATFQCHEYSDFPMSQGNDHKKPSSSNQKEVTTPATSSREGFSLQETLETPREEKEKKEEFFVFSAYEEFAPDQSGPVVLTAREKRDLKNLAAHVTKCEIDPVEVIKRVLSDWAEFREFVRVHHGKPRNPWSIPEVPSPRALCQLRQEAVSFYRESIAQDELEAQRLAKWEKRKNHKAKPLFVPLSDLGQAERDEQSEAEEPATFDELMDMFEQLEAQHGYH